MAAEAEAAREARAKAIQVSNITENVTKYHGNVANKHKNTIQVSNITQNVTKKHKNTIQISNTTQNLKKTQKYNLDIKYN